MALVLDSMCRGDAMTPIDVLASRLPTLVMEKAKIDLAPETSGPALAAAFPEARADRLDGLRLDWPGGWLLVRASNTEPIVRIVAEATSSTAVAAAIATARRVIAGSHEPFPRA